MSVGDQLRKAQAQADSGFSNRSPTNAVAPCPLEKTHWLEIRLVDDEGRPVGGEPYLVYPASGDKIAGKLDADGYARLERLAPGTCKVTFPQREQRWWEPEPKPSPPPLATPAPVQKAALPPVPDAWIEIQLVDDTGMPVPYEPFEIRYGGETLMSDRLDERGFARVESLMKGRCQVVFPRREPSWWAPDALPAPPPRKKKDSAPADSAPDTKGRGA